MKKDIHPTDYRPVVFLDNSCGAMFLINSAVKTKETVKFTDGKEYPAYHLEISSASHPFYTGNDKVLDSAGRVEKFKNRQAQAKPKAESKAKVVKSAETK